MIQDDLAANEDAVLVNPATAFRIVNRLVERGMVDSSMTKTVRSTDPDRPTVRGHRRFRITELGIAELARRKA